MRWRQVVSDWREVLLVIAAAVIGLVFAGAGQVLVDHGAINIVLFVLVLAAAMTLRFHALTALRPRAARLSIVATSVIVALPIIAWLASQLVPDGPARLGIMAIGVAPAEIATVALTTAAGGATATAACFLLVSTGVTALLAAPILGVIAGAGSVNSRDLVVTVVFVVVLPFVLGLLIRARTGDAHDIEGRAGQVATGAVVVLVGLVATQVTFDTTLLRVAVALAVLILASAGLGLALGRATAPEDRSAVLLSVSMRDFAVASGIAAAAFGPAAAAPLGLYGVMVMIWGSLVAAWSRRSDRSTGVRLDGG